MSTAILLLAAASAFSQEYRLEPGGNNQLFLEADKTGLMKGKKHNIAFPKFTGKLSYDAQTPVNSKVELKVDATAVEVRDTWLNEKDRRKVLDWTHEEMLLSKKYPEMRFSSTKINSLGGNRYQVEGTLIIRGVGKPVTLETTLDPAAMRIDGKAGFKLTAYGMKPPSAALGAIGTKDDVTASFQVTAVK